MNDDIRNADSLKNSKQVGASHGAVPKSSVPKAAVPILGSKQASSLHSGNTEIFEMESDYPYCKLPEHYFERILELAAVKAGRKSGLSLEILRR